MALILVPVVLRIEGRGRGSLCLLLGLALQKCELVDVTHRDCVLPLHLNPLGQQRRRSLAFFSFGGSDELGRLVPDFASFVKADLGALGLVVVEKGLAHGQENVIALDLGALTGLVQQRDGFLGSAELNEEGGPCDSGFEISGISEQVQGSLGVADESHEESLVHFSRTF